MAEKRAILFFPMTTRYHEAFASPTGSPRSGNRNRPGESISGEAASIPQDYCATFEGGVVRLSSEAARDIARVVLKAKEYDAAAREIVKCVLDRHLGFAFYIR